MDGVTQDYNEKSSRGLAQCLESDGPLRRGIHTSSRQEVSISAEGLSERRGEISAALCFALELYDEDIEENVDLCDKKVLEEAVKNKISRDFGEYVDGSPMSVDLVLEKGACDVSATANGLFEVRGTSSFSSVRGSLSLDPSKGGKWMYEVQLHTSGIMQLGWVTPVTLYTPEDGVGDSKDSFAYDGKRVRKWNVASIHYGDQWTAGDVISCGVDFENGNIEYWRNGTYLGIAYSPSSLKEWSYFPAVSLSYGEGCEINFGAIPFTYPAPGYSPILEPPDQMFLDKSKYLMDCLERLTIVGVACERQKGRCSPRAAAAHAAVHAMEFLFEDDDDDEALEEIAQTRKKEEKTVHEVLHDLHNDAFGKSQVLAAEVLMQSLGDSLANQYAVISTALESCKRMRSYDSSDLALCRFIHILAESLPAKIGKQFVHAICMGCNRRVKGNIWSREDDPAACDAVVYCHIWGSFMKYPRMMRLWMRSGNDWMEEFEGFFFVRQPTNADLSGLIPAVVEDCDIESVIDKILGFGSIPLEDGFYDVVADIIVFLSCLDDMHCMLLTRLMSHSLTIDGVTWRRDLDSSMVDDYLEIFEADQVTELPREQWTEVVIDAMTFDESLQLKKVPQSLQKFMQYIIKKNIGANREVTPPGLSHPSVICSLLGFMARASRRYLKDIHLDGSEFAFPRQVFLKGIRSVVFGSIDDLDDDNLEPDARVGGSLSFLTKTSLVDVCQRAVSSRLRVPALDESEKSFDWPISKQLRPRKVFEGDETPEWSWWIMNNCFILFHLGGGQMIKKISTFMQTFEAAMISYKNMIDRFENDADNIGTDILEFSLKECKKTIMESLRMLMWHLNWLMPKWKQQTFGALASSMSRVILAMTTESKETSDLSYVAGFYVDATLEMVLACRSSDFVSWQSIEEQSVLSFESVLRMCINLIRDPRVVNPRVQNSVLYSIWIMLRDEDTCRLVCLSPYARQQLLPCLIESFEHQRNWIHASNAFGLLVQNSGLAPRIGSEEVSEEIKACRDVVRGWLGTILRENHSLGKKLFDGLIDRLNWISPELIVIIEDLGNQLNDPTSHDDMVLNYRRAMAACDLCYHLLRLLEAACASDPEAILASVDKNNERELLMTRLSELIGWGLRNFCEKSHVHKLMSDIHAEYQRGRIGLGRDVRPTMISEILGPYLGIISALYQYNRRAECGVSAPHSRSDMPDETVVDGFQLFVHYLQENSVSGELIQECLLTVATITKSGLDPPREEEVNNIKAVITCFSNQAKGLSSGDFNPSSSTASQHMVIPEEFLDPILNVLMKDPVILPDSKVTLDRRTIQRHLSISSTDPFSRQQLTEADLIENAELKKSIEDWLLKYSNVK
jgi:hypothetical protein